MPLAIKFQINTQKTQIRAGTFICFVAPVKKIYGVPPPRFNLVSEVLALFDQKRESLSKTGGHLQLRSFTFWH